MVASAWKHSVFRVLRVGVARMAAPPPYQETRSRPSLRWQVLARQDTHLGNADPGEGAEGGEGPGEGAGEGGGGGAGGQEKR